MDSSAPPRRGPPAGLLAALAALLLVLLLLLGAVLGMGPGERAELRDAVALPTPTPTPAVGASRSPSPTPLGGAAPAASGSPDATRSPDSQGDRPDIAVVVAEDGQVTVLSTADGSAVRVLVEAGALGGVHDISLSPDRQTAYLSAGDCPGATVFAVPVDGGEAQQVVEGSAAAVSPDGVTLAYAAAGESDATLCPTTLVLRDLGSGQERRLAPADEGDSPPSSIRELSWAPDSRRLAVETVYEQTSVGVLDTSAADSLDDQRHLDADDGDLSSPVWLPQGDRIALSRTCCMPEYEEPAVPLAVPLGGGDAEPVLDSEAAGIPLAVDRTGEQLLVLLGEELVMVPVAGGEPETLASGGLVVDAAW